MPEMVVWGNAAHVRELGLGQTLQLMTDAHRLTRGYINTLFCRMNVRISSSPVVMKSHANHLDA